MAKYRCDELHISTWSSTVSVGNTIALYLYLSALYGTWKKIGKIIMHIHSPNRRRMELCLNGQDEFWLVCVLFFSTVNCKPINVGVLSQVRLRIRLRNLCECFTNCTPTQEQIMLCNSIDIVIVSRFLHNYYFWYKNIKLIALTVNSKLIIYTLN